jgi:hypothetical protein
MSINLVSLLARIQSKIESRTRRPWFDLHQSYYYKNKKGIQSIKELSFALEHFHVGLTQAELQFVYETFPSKQQQGYFDFKEFAHRLFPSEALDESVLIHEKPLKQVTKDEEQGRSNNFNKSFNDTNAILSNNPTAATDDHDFVLVEHRDALPSSGANNATAQSHTLGEPHHANGAAHYYEKQPQHSHNYTQTANNSNTARSSTLSSARRTKKQATTGRNKLPPVTYRIHPNRTVQLSATGKSTK